MILSRLYKSFIGKAYGTKPCTDNDSSDKSDYMKLWANTLTDDCTKCMPDVKPGCPTGELKAICTTSTTYTISYAN